jgi:O-antigen/teichoic acid export membrane protein
MELLNRLKDTVKNGTAGKFLKLSSGTIIAQIIGLAATPILTRYYTEDDFGVYAIYLSLLIIIATSATLRYEMGIIPSKTDEDARRVAWNAGISTLLISGFTFIGLLLAGSWFQELMEIPSESFWLFYFLPAAIIAMAFYNILFNHHNRFENYSFLGKAKIFQITSVSGIQLTGISLLLQKTGLIAGDIIGRLLTILYFFRFNLPHIWSAIIKRPSNRALKVNAYKNKAYPKFNLAAAFIDRLSFEIPVLVITKLFELATVGFYSIAMRVLSLPAMFIGQAMAQVFYKTFTDYSYDYKLAKKFLFKTWGFLSLVGLLPLVIILGWGPEIFAFVLGNDWYVAGEMARVIAPMLFVMFVSSPSSNAYLTLNMHHLTPIFPLISLIYRPGCIYIGYLMGDILTGLWILTIVHIVFVVLYNLVIIKKLSVK